MSLPRILVVDDQYARDASERRDFVEATCVIEAASAGADSSNAVASVTFCSGQRQDNERIVNDFEIVRAAVEKLGEKAWSLALVDMRFDSGPLDPNGDPRGAPGDDEFGETVRRRLAAAFPALPVVVLTGKTHAELGNQDVAYLSKYRIDAHTLSIRLLQHGRLTPDQVRRLLDIESGVAAESPLTLQFFKEAFVHSRTRNSILITGESGVGKEILARYIHRLSGRRGNFAAINVSAIAKDLVESELFGIESRVATQVAERVGVFEFAHNGTLFLDEIGDMPLDIQSKVLRAIQQREILRVGGREPTRVDIRLLSATNKPLEEMVRSGSFREELLHRINTAVIRIPPLRERREDFEPLVDVLLTRVMEAEGKRDIRLSKEALNLIKEQPFPGNVRELENVIQRVAAAAGHNEIINARTLARSLEPKPGTRSGKQGARQEPESVQVQVTANPSIGSFANLPALISRVIIDKDDDALKSALPNLTAAHERLLQRLAGAALERCRDPSTHEYNLQAAMRLLTGNQTLKGQDPARALNKILGETQATPVTREKMQSLVDRWKKGNDADDA